MTQSHIQLRNEIKENTIKAVLDLQQKRKKEIKRRKPRDYGVFFKIILLPVLMVIICFTAVRLIPFSTSLGNKIYNSNFQYDLGKEVSAVISSNTPEQSRISVLLLFSSRNKRYSPMAETLVEDLYEKGYIVREAWPLDNKLIDEDEYETSVNKAISNNTKKYSNYSPQNKK